MVSVIKERHILLGVTGSIAAYKAVDLASRLTQAGAQVDVLLTQAAMEFIAPLTFQSLTSRPAYVNADLWANEGHVLHIGLGKSADLMLIAPATANTLAKLAHGLADNLLTLTALAADCPLVIAPAMDGGMFAHPATQANLDLLRQRGVTVVGPVEGHLASGATGVGRMVEPQELLGHVRFELSRRGSLNGRKIVVTAGGTQEPIDPVRIIANRSSGKQGFALAQAALDLGANVILVSGPVNLTTPVGVQRVDVRTAQEMLDAVEAAMPGTDVLIMAAAVADFKPVRLEVEKIKKGSGFSEIELEPTPDVLSAVAQYRSEQGWPRFTVGFAAESGHLLEHARGKLEAKNLDMIVANDINAVDAGFGVDTNRVMILYPDGRTEHLPLMKKSQVAEVVLDRVMEFILTDESLGSL